MNNGPNLDIEVKNKQLAQRWIDATVAGDLYNAYYEEFCKLVEYEAGFLFTVKWPGFGRVDTFPFSAIYLENCIDSCMGIDDEDEAVHCFRCELEPDGSHEYFYLREVIASDGRATWILVRCESRGQAGTDESIEDTFPTPLAAEESLRADGYIFTEAAPSGKIDSFTDEQICDLVRKAGNLTL